MSCSINIQETEGLKQFLFQQEKSEKDRVTCYELPRGGLVFNTKVGNIQYGIPPETVKDCMNLKISMPKYYIIPSQRLDLENFLNVAEFEFPAYFNFFVTRKRVQLICSEQARDKIITVFTETLLGPEQIYDDKDYDGSDKCVADLRKELTHFAVNPFNPSEPLQVETLLDFICYDQNGIAKISDDVQIKFDKQQKMFHLIQDNKKMAQFKDEIKVNLRGTGLLQQINEQKINYGKIPSFGITVLGNSHGFDPQGSNSGFVIWINGKGILVDPPVFSTKYLENQGINNIQIDSIIITHCHADHDSGVFQKILKSGKVEVITSHTIMQSFLRKYSALTDIPIDELKSYFIFRPVVLQSPMRLNGAIFEFFYSFHTIPSLGFTINYQGKSIYVSGDTFYDPLKLQLYAAKGIMSQERADMLTNKIYQNHDLILHEAGVPPIHTPISVLVNLPDKIKDKMYLVHIAKKDLPLNCGLKQAEVGFDKTIFIDVEIDQQQKTFMHINVLSTIPIFYNCQLKQIKDLYQSSQLQEYQTGSTIIEENTLGELFFIIIEGQVRVFNQYFNGIYGVGDYFGERALQQDQLRASTVTALTNVVLLAIKRRDFRFIFGFEGHVMNKINRLKDSRAHQYYTIITQNSILNRMDTYLKIEFEIIISEKKQFKKDDVIWNMLSNIEFVCIVCQGQLKFVGCQDKFVTGTLISETQQILNNGIHNTTLMAITDCQLLIIKKKKFYNFLINLPGLLLNLKYLNFAR